MLAYILGLLSGAASPTQASVNTRVREDLRSPYITSVVNFISSIVIIALMTLLIEGDLIIPVAQIAKEPFWIWLGGACGTAIVILNILCVPKLGSARNVMLICFGQIMTGLIIDHFGLFSSPQVPMSLKRAAGALLVFAGIVLVNRTGGKGEGYSASREGAKGGSLILYIFLAVCCGISCSAQVALNGALNVAAGSALKATFISMVVGLIATFIVTAIVMMIRGRYGIYDGGRDHGPVTFRAWMPAGGAIAIIIVGGNVIIAPVLGTGIVTILNLIGMMAAGLVIDATGFLGIEIKPVTAVKLAGMALMIGGAAVISLM